jgi:hypothetical protein
MGVSPVEITLTVGLELGAGETRGWLRGAPAAESGSGSLAAKRMRLPSGNQANSAMSPLELEELPRLAALEREPEDLRVRSTGGKEAERPSIGGEPGGGLALGMMSEPAQGTRVEVEQPQVGGVPVGGAVHRADPQQRGFAVRRGADLLQRADPEKILTGWRPSLGLAPGTCRTRRDIAPDDPARGWAASVRGAHRGRSPAASAGPGSGAPGTSAPS